MEIDFKLRISHLVALQPGLHLRQLQRLLGVSFSSTRYHVERMARDGEIIRIEDGGYSRLFPARTDDQDATLLAAMRRSTSLFILSSLARKGILSQKDLCDITGLAKSTVSEAVKGLLERDVIRTQSNSSLPTLYSLANPQRVHKLLNSNIGLLGKATVRFIELWDF